MEPTNFFKKVEDLQLTGDLHITIRQAAAGQWVVSTLLTNEACTDDAKKLIPPYTLRGTAEELDKGFFEAISPPLQAVAGLVADMEAYQQQLALVRLKTAAEKDKADKDRKNNEGLEKKYKDALQKVDELEKQGRYREAWSKLPDPALYPAEAAAIQKRRETLFAKFKPDLWSAATESPAVHTSGVSKDDDVDEDNDWDNGDDLSEEDEL